MNEQRVVGIGYGDDDVAPMVLLKAGGAAAKSLLDQAAQEEIPVVRDSDLVNQLYRVPIDRPIGRELFPVMAILLAHVLKIDRNADSAEHGESNHE